MTECGMDLYCKACIQQMSDDYFKQWFNDHPEVARLRAVAKAARELAENVDDTMYGMELRDGDLDNLNAALDALEKGEAK